MKRCSNCGGVASDGDTRCICGNTTFDDTVERNHYCNEKFSKNCVPDKLHARILNECELCGKPAIVYHSVFSYNISYFIARKEKTIDAYLCLDCTYKIYGSFTLYTALGTWWGVVGIIIGPFIIIANTCWLTFNSIRFLLKS